MEKAEGKENTCHRFRSHFGSSSLLLGWPRGAQPSDVLGRNVVDSRRVAAAARVRAGRGGIRSREAFPVAGLSGYGAERS